MTLRARASDSWLVRRAEWRTEVEGSGGGVRRFRGGMEGEEEE
eukprot:CAMPEP_0182468148 /NCGR_PEP_ID=MMETSP1319-20130603/15031_1 /TAXON_ID=172717 /ORGANISM="Bolidomonas pacifica, Strain RCC208" /LENGTH=42 /DNA_ID= /DNA_START= /DNA_END= /DNA_ORIENTATION=